MNICTGTVNTTYSMKLIHSYNIRGGTLIFAACRRKHIEKSDTMVPSTCTKM